MKPCEPTSTKIRGLFGWRCCGRFVALLFCGWAVPRVAGTVGFLKSAPSTEGTSGDDARSTTTLRLCHEHVHWKAHPVLCELLERSDRDPYAFSREAYEWARNNHLLVDLTTRSISRRTAGEPERRLTRGARSADSSDDPSQRLHRQGKEQLPVVFAHGMGDSCFNSGMQHIVEKVSGMLDGSYATCVPTGDTQGEDTKNGYFLSMDDSTDVFAAKIRSDPQLAGGFHAVGFSQGANVIRGYIAKYNDPPVHTFLSVNGVNAGIGAVPYCRPSASSSRSFETKGAAKTTMCDLLMEQASHAAYTEFAQRHSFQANYWRDPRPSAQSLYREYSQLAAWNNEVLEPNGVNETLRANWNRTRTFVWIMASDDQMVWPKEGEQWCAPDPADPFERVLERNRTEWYAQDLFGLRSAEQAGKNRYETFEGDHLQFTEEDFDRWVNSYLRDGARGVPDPSSSS